MTFERNESHVEDGLLKFAAPFWGKPRWAALYAALAREVQAIEDAACDVIQKKMLANAGPAQLKLLGKLVGQTDPGLGQEVFRNLIRVRIRVRRSQGSRNDVIEVLQLLGIPLAQRSIINSPPAKIRIDFTGVLPLPTQLLTDLLNQTCSAGVGAVVVYEPTGGLGFSFSNNTNVAGASDAWADGSAPGVKWAAVFQV